jgi:dipeptidyl aminopeptidase/acylaminoacyl peptidase
VYYSWSKLPDDTLTTVVREKSGAKSLPFQTYWSPDGHYLIAPRVDERKVGGDPVVEWVPTDGSRRPIVHTVRLAFPGDRDTAKIDYFLFDLQSGRRQSIELPEGYKPGIFDGLVLAWSQKRGQAFLLARTAGSKMAAVFRIELASGMVTKVIEESSTTRVATNTIEYNEPNIRVIGDGAEIIWYSDRTGFGHLYLYDAQSGQLKNAITRGNWLVQDIHAVDEARREIYFTAVGREPGRDPYYRHLYRASLDNHTSIRLLTEPNADHQLEPNPAPGFAWIVGAQKRAPLIQVAAGEFIDTWSTVDQPPISVLRSTRDGHIIESLEVADVSRLLATGWTPPTRERVKAADGKTDLYAVYYAPYKEHIGSPVIDAAYGGPQIVVTPRNFHEAYRSENPLGARAVAHLGFAVVTVDGRGTPMRSRAFRDIGYTEFTQVGIDDHVAAIQELARRHPQIDTARAGIYGWSWGGTFTAQAILTRPEFYKVAVSGAGVYDYGAMYSVQFDNMIGPPVYADGSAYRGKPDEAPANWSKLNITRLANNLEGHLLIIFGDMDENVPPHQALRLVNALTLANKPYDLLYLPNRNHGSGARDGYTIKRTWDYFIQYLHGAPPIRDLKVAVRAP